MFLRATIRKKDGKEHRYFSVVENKRVSGGRVLQRHVLYLGEINSSQELAWRRSIEVLDEGTRAARTLALFPEDRCEGMVADESGRAPEARAIAAGAAAAVGRMLACVKAMAAARARGVLERAPAALAQRHALRSGAVGAGGVSALVAGQRVAITSALV